MVPHSSGDVPQARLHVVTGKGGTGKTTVAAALALALAARGRTVLLCEVEGRQGIARMFDVDPLPYAERRIATGLPEEDGERGGVVHALHIDPESALLEYLSMYYKLGSRRPGSWTASASSSSPPRSPPGSATCC